MKKISALILTLAIMLSLASCKESAKTPGGESSGAQSAVEVLDKVWNSFSEDEKFPATGGDFNVGNNKMNAPGKYSLEDGAAIDSALGIPEGSLSSVDDAASLVHMMNANTFTCGAFGLKSSSDSAAVVSALRDNIMNRQWICGFPDELVIITTGDFVISMFGSQDLIDAFKTKTLAAYSDAEVEVEQSLL